MVTIQLSHEQRVLALRAMKAVAEADGALDAHELQLLTAAARALACSQELESLEPITPEEAAQQVSEPALRELLLQALVVVSIIDKDPSAAEVAWMDAFAKGVGMDLSSLATLKKVVAGQLLSARLDLARKGIPGKIVGKAWEQEGLKGIWKFLGGPKGWYEDAELAWKYKQLGLLPQGTLGRAYWEYCTRNKFGFPGEPHALSEWLVIHDMLHSVNGYDSSPKGELEVGMFQGGMLGGLPGFYMCFGIMMVFYLGIAPPGEIVPTEATDVDSAVLVKAYQRGFGVKQNLLLDWNYWEDVGRSLEEVRARLGIVVEA